MQNIRAILKTKFTNKKVGILGLGIENYALIKFLITQRIKCKITICDSRNYEELIVKYKFLANKKGISWKLGVDEIKRLDGFDVLYRSPGWPVFDPAIAEAVKLGVKFSSAINLFFRLCPTENIIGITGTKGKGTTATLIYEILKEAGKRVWLGGNIGIAPFEFLSKIRKTDWVVLELSSFQLEDLRFSPHIAVITNFYSEHLAPADPNNPNYHKSIKKYWSAKVNIIKLQKNHDKAIINIKLKKRNLNYGTGKRIFFDKSDLLSKLPGEHNKENIAAAVLSAKAVGIKNSIIVKTVAKFKGLEHRLELVKILNSVKYYNDSFATTPEAAITALKSFKEPIVLLAGGADKKSNFGQLARIIKRKVKFVILLAGNSTPRIRKELAELNYSKNKIFLTGNIKMAVKKAREIARSGDIVLLSPACASFGMFKNYKERGSLFKEAVRLVK
jgi:UDP-N-acetylmuramoylalanine--D-glutamate ligase